jgi:hypothetical protein
MLFESQMYLIESRVILPEGGKNISLFSLPTFFFVTTNPLLDPFLLGKISKKDNILTFKKKNEKK